MGEKITIKNFCNGYRECTTENSQKNYLKKNLEVKPYISFIMKETLANKLADITLFEYEDYEDADGQTKRRKTGNVKNNSSMNYLFFWRIVIEVYTNLQIETEGFYEEYDMLDELGLMDKITEIIPNRELTEFKMICDMKKNDVIFNNTTPRAYVNQQIERFVSISSFTLKTIFERIETEINNMDEDKMDKLLNKIDRFVKLVK